MAKFSTLLFLQLLSFISFLSTTDADYNVLHFGAKPDGRTDSAQSFLRAWTAACSSSYPATIQVPSGKFLISQVKFNGPCRNTGIKFLISGVIIAPSIYARRGDKSNWIEFDEVDGVSIDGGIFDGQGAPVWNCKLRGHNCPDGATVCTTESVLGLIR